jgi:hypothetical protein
MEKLKASKKKRSKKERERLLMIWDLYCQMSDLSENIATNMSYEYLKEEEVDALEDIMYFLDDRKKAFEWIDDDEKYGDIKDEYLKTRSN